MKNNIHLFLLLSFLLFGGISVADVNLNAQAKSGWTCAPQQILIGQWNIEIRTDLTPARAITHFSAEITPTMQPFLQRLVVSENQVADNGLLFLGENFKIIIYPDREPARSIFEPTENAVDALVARVRYGPHAELINRAFACVPKIYEN